MKEAAAITLCVLAAALGLAWWIERRRRLASEAQQNQALQLERRLHEADLREEARRTAALFDSMVEGIIVVDETGAVRLANRAAGALFGFEPPATGRRLIEAVRNHEVAAIASRLEKEPKILGHELRIEGVGEPRQVQVNALALRDRAGGPDGSVLVFHDLTRLKQLESARQEFVANVSHELRTPLSLIKGYVETLLDGAKDNPEVATKFLQTIDRNADRLKLLIEDLLTISELESGRLKLNLQDVALGGLVGKVLDDFKTRAEAKGMSIVNETPDLAVRADIDRLEQVLGNLVENAIKYGRSKGTVIVGGRAVDNGQVEVVVQDDGPGIPPEALERLFERFYRVDKARSREQGGTGLGLAIVKHIVQSHGGRVWATSELGRGATFRFILPTTKKRDFLTRDPCVEP